MGQLRSTEVKRLRDRFTIIYPSVGQFSSLGMRHKCQLHCQRSQANSMLELLGIPQYYPLMVPHLLVLSSSGGQGYIATFATNQAFGL